MKNKTDGAYKSKPNDKKEQKGFRAEQSDRPYTARGNERGRGGN